MNLPLDHQPILDCSAEESAFRPAGDQPLKWTADQVRSVDWCIPLTGEALDEIARLAAHIDAHPMQNLQREVDDFRIPALRADVAKMKRALDHDLGFAVLDRLPIDAYDIDTIVEIYWLIGQLVGRPVAQKWNGQMIYAVADTGQAYQYGVRGSHTAVELVFHTDNAFARAVPDYVGLLCRHPALSGGLSRFCSLYTVHERLEQRYPDALRVLYRSMLFDRQKEHAPGAARVCYAPFFSWRGDRLFARANTSLVRKGYQVAGIDMADDLADALDAVDDVCAAGELWFEAPLERGQVQYLNNHEIGHYRSAFVDHEDPDRKRYLYRLWHRQSGAATYDGVTPAI